MPSVLHERQRIYVEMGQLVYFDPCEGISRDERENDYVAPKTKHAELSEESIKRIAKSSAIRSFGRDDFDNNDAVALHTMPKKVRSDWKAAEECRRLMLKYGINPDAAEKFEKTDRKTKDTDRL